MFGIQHRMRFSDKQSVALQSADPRCTETQMYTKRTVPSVYGYLSSVNICAVNSKSSTMAFANGFLFSTMIAA